MASDRADDIVSRVLAAGGVVTRRAVDGALEVLVVHRPKYDDWSLPKGKVDDGDDSLEHTALREMQEETGYECVLGPAVGMVSYVDSQGRDKTVSYWMARPVRGQFEQSHEVDEGRWLPVAAAATLVSRPDDGRIVQAVAARTAPRFVFLVRHASAGDRATGPNDDRLRPLDATGAAQAAALVGFAAGGVTQLWSSPYLRCRETLEPLAAATGVSVTDDPFFSEGADPRDALDRLATAGDATVACTHGDVLDGVLSLLARRGVRFPAHRNGAKGSAWVLTGTGGDFTAASYLALR